MEKRSLAGLVLVLLTAYVESGFFDALKCNGSSCGNGQLKNETEEVVKKLDLTYQEFSAVPTALLQKHADTVEILNLAENKIGNIKLGSFPYMPKLHTLILRKNVISEVEYGSFEFLPSLMVLRIEDNFLKKIPGMANPLKLYELDISFNQVEEISQNDLKSYTLLKTLILRGNKIQSLKNEVFKSNLKLTELDLSDNPLTEMESKSLIGPKTLRRLFLENTHISKLPERGIEHLHRLKIKGINELWSVPEPSVFQALKKVEVTYSVHCCPFRGLHTAETKPDGVISCADFLAAQKSTTIRPTKRAATTNFVRRELRNSSAQRSVLGKPKALPFKFGFHDLHDDDDESDDDDDDDDNDDEDDPFKDFLKSFKKTNATSRPLCSQTNDTLVYVPPSRRVTCSPAPDAFNPCDDVIGTTVLRVFSWISCLLAIFGNIFLLLVLYSNESPLTVYKLLMYHLAVANGIMGLYLGILCSLDAYTFNRYYNYVRTWQYSGGCKVAGFLAVFSTELSVCVLAIVTIERYLLIVHALHIRRQMKLIHAKLALIVAWTYSFVVAILPVTNVISSYEKVAVCLPFETSNKLSEGYIAWLLLYYVLMFVYIIVSYLKMYVSVNGAPSCAGANTEFKVAKRFSLIVFCNFACWLPISIAGFMAMYSKIPMSIKVSKFLIVFAFPLNACTNPFLYAFFTRIFKGDVLHFFGKIGITGNKRRYSPKNAYIRGRYGSRASDGTVSTSGVSRFSPPGTLKSVTFNKKPPSDAFQNAAITGSDASKSNSLQPHCYRSISIETTATNTTCSTDTRSVENKQPVRTERKPSGLQTVLDGLWALTTGKRNRNESTSSSKELLSSFDPDQFARARSVSEAVEIACHDDQLLSGDVIDIDKMSPGTNVTNL